MIVYSAGWCSQAILLFTTSIVIFYGDAYGKIEGVNLHFYSTTRYGTEKAKRAYPPASEDCSCKPGQISCIADCSCILTSQVCDNVIDCTDGRDEANCTPQLCYGRFACRSGECVRQELTCDGVEDCRDGSDELMCRGRLPETRVYNCSGSHIFNCTDGAYCVPASWKCDGDFDCYDKSDESDCIYNTTCQPTEFRCRTGKCIGLPFVCDGQTDCEDASDEINCSLDSPKRKCNETEFICSTAGRCVSKHYVCDGEDDCGDWSDEKDCNITTSCSTDNFRCKSGRCIESGWLCDGTPDCDDNEDEKDCPNPATERDCPSGTFFCPHVCISVDWRCDGEFDCPGGEDELDCQKQFTCGNEMFSCGYGRECIPKYRVCDGHQDCLDGRDENNCTKRECRKLTCSSGCHSWSEERENCICPVGFTVALDNNTCIDVDECEKFLPCSQLCENTEGSFRCSCVSGYNIRPDKMSCKAQPPPARIIFATRDDVREINLSGQEYPPIAMSLENAIAVDFHYRRGLIYWSDVTIDAILMAYQNGSGKAQIVRWGLQQPCGLSVDWYNDNIYWVDSITRRVEVAELDGSNRRPLIWTDLQKPRSIVVHPKRSLIIWTDWGENARIEKAYMDGSGRSVLIGDRLFWPNGITIDYPTETLYWVDAKQHVIEEAYIDGTKRRKLLVMGR